MKVVKVLNGFKLESEDPNEANLLLQFWCGKIRAAELTHQRSEGTATIVFEIKEGG